MKRTTLWAPCAALLLCAATHANAQTYAQFSATPTSEVKDNGSGLIGIGNISPVSAKLHVYHSGSEPVIQASLSGNTTVRPSHYFLAEKRTFTGTIPNLVLTQTTDFVIDSIGRVGIGIAKPNTLLTIKVRNWPASNREDLIDVRDANNNPLMRFANEGTSTDPGASLGVYAKSDRIGLAVVTASEAVKFCVYGNGRVGMNTYTPAATLDIQRDAGGSLDIINVGTGIFKMLYNGNVQIFPSGAATGPALAVGKQIDIYGNSTTPALLRFGSGTSTPRHIITENTGGDMLIDPGISGGGANDKLVVDGDLTVKNTSGDVYFDITENTTSAWNAQLRFIGSTGNVRHVITDVNNELYIDPGFNGNASDNVKLAGNLITTGIIQIGNVTTPCTTGSCYSLYAEKGILTERVKCAVKTDNVNWSDYVFAKDYKLMKLSEVEKYVTKNKHLPNVPSAEEVYKEGIDLAQMDATLLEKIEELTLYVIQQQKEIDELRKLIKKQ